MSGSISVTITQQEKYQFLVDFGAAIPNLLADESEPIGQGSGPDPSHMLLASVANCLSASLLFSLQKFKQDPGGIVATATCTIDRNESNRLRIQHIDVSISLGKQAAEIEHLDRVLGQFKDFCTVSQSVQTGIPISVIVKDGSGASLG